MPVKKRTNLKNNQRSARDNAHVPTKEHSTSKRLQIGITGEHSTKRVTALSTVGKKRKPK